MARQHGIIAYGEREDREKLKAIAEAERLSGSEWIIKAIRSRHEDLFGKDL